MGFRMLDYADRVLTATNVEERVGARWNRKVVRDRQCIPFTSSRVRSLRAVSSTRPPHSTQLGKNEYFR